MKLISGIAEKIYDLLETHGYSDLFVRKETAGRLYINEDVKGIVKKKGLQLITRIILILISTGSICAVVLMTDKKIIGDDNTLRRAGSGEGDKTYSLEVSGADGERETVNVSVTEQEVPGEKIAEVFENAEKSLMDAIRGDNPSLDNVGTSLDLIGKVEGTKVSVTWEADEEGFFSKTGRIRITPKEPVCVTLYATLRYFEHSRRIPVRVTIVPPTLTELSEKEKRTRMLENAIRMADGEAPGAEKIFLPNEAGGEQLTWQEPMDVRTPGIALLGLLLAVMVIPRARSALRDEEKKRKEQMERDYPEIVSKLILLLTAGMTCSGAWKRICNDYLAAKPRLGKRFAYEEMVFSLREMELGRSEAAVYESFGNRTGIVCYKRLSAMLSRNLRRGSREILTMLDLESRDAYAARFEAVRKKGEETSTKLLLPMMGMLVIVIAIIVVPAFMGMGF